LPGTITTIWEFTRGLIFAKFVPARSVARSNL
jgi:hypothetical protein